MGSLPSCRDTRGTQKRWLWLQSCSGFCLASSTYCQAPCSSYPVASSSLHQFSLVSVTLILEDLTQDFVSRPLAVSSVWGET